MIFHEFSGDVVFNLPNYEIMLADSTPFAEETPRGDANFSPRGITKLKQL